MSIEKIVKDSLPKFMELLPLLFGNINDYIYNNEICNYIELRRVITTFMKDIFEQINKK
jgi:hypothetical protein